jgi:hypothetical protein
MGKSPARHLPDRRKVLSPKGLRRSERKGRGDAKLVREGRPQKTCAPNAPFFGGTRKACIVFPAAPHSRGLPPEDSGWILAGLRNFQRHCGFIPRRGIRAPSRATFLGRPLSPPWKSGSSAVPRRRPPAEPTEVAVFFVLHPPMRIGIGPGTKGTGASSSAKPSRFGRRRRSRSPSCRARPVRRYPPGHPTVVVAPVRN